MSPSNKLDFSKVSIEDIDKIVSLRLALLKKLGELTSPQEEFILENSTREYLQKIISNNEFISYMSESNGEAVSISGMVLFTRLITAIRMYHFCHVFYQRLPRYLPLVAK